MTRRSTSFAVTSGRTERLVAAILTDCRRACSSRAVSPRSPARAAHATVRPDDAGISIPRGHVTSESLGEELEQPLQRLRLVLARQVDGVYAERLGLMIR